ncbi:MAG: NAD(P)-dependent oxidoreductase [Anaerolineales bacterium]|nr:NAD(P)-dependent oxidoreductase [Anaerolineales bacterium]
MILVTGGGGLIGRRVCGLLAAHGYEVVAVDRNRITGLPCQTVQGDLTSQAFLNELFRGYSFAAVVHLASLLNTASQKQPQEAMRVNIGGSLGLLEAAAQARVPKFIYGSSISAYGSKPYAQYGEVAESEPASPEDVYGLCKRYVEIVGESYRQQHGMQFVALRIASVISPGAMQTASPWRYEIFEKLRVNRPAPIHFPYQAGQRFPLIYLDDVAEVIRRFVAETRIAETIYNTPAENWRFGELATYLQTLNSQIEFTYGSTPASGLPEAINGCRFIHEFGFSPIPVKERLRCFLEGGGN